MSPVRYAVLLTVLIHTVLGGEYCGCYGYGCIGWCDDYCCGTTNVQYCCNNCAYAYPGSICWVPVGTIVAVSVTCGLMLIAMVACICALVLRKDHSISRSESAAILYPQETTIIETGPRAYSGPSISYGALPGAFSTGYPGAPPPYTAQAYIPPPPAGTSAASNMGQAGPSNAPQQSSSDTFWEDPLHADPNKPNQRT